MECGDFRVGHWQQFQNAKSEKNDRLIDVIPQTCKSTFVGMPEEDVLGEGSRKFSSSDFLSKLLI
jgi:hypothetical protein